MVVSQFGRAATPLAAVNVSLYSARSGVPALPHKLVMEIRPLSLRPRDVYFVLVRVFGGNSSE